MAATSEGVDFDWLDKRNMGPVAYKRVNKRTGRKIDKDNIVKAQRARVTPVPTKLHNHHHGRIRMSDDKAEAGGADRRRISLSEDYEVRDWSKKFGVTAEELKAAVAEVGNEADAVEAHLKSKR